MQFTFFRSFCLAQKSQKNISLCTKIDVDIEFFFFENSRKHYVEYVLYENLNYKIDIDFKKFVHKWFSVSNALSK